MLNKIAEPLLQWYEKNHRILPWRDSGNPYYIWISEIMLQQTRVEAVKPYFERFICALPSVKDVAECPEEQLLKLDIHPKQIEGYNTGNWILLDYSDFIIHIFNQEDRLFYDLERIWKDGKVVEDI